MKGLEIVTATPSMISDVIDFWRKVYVEKKHYIDPTDWYPDDPYNRFSTIFVAKYDNNIVGTLRATLDNSLGFPTEYHYPNLQLGKLDREKIMDVGRAMRLTDCKLKIADRIMLALYREAYIFSIYRGITHWLMFINPPYLRRLCNLGFLIKPILKGDVLNVGSMKGYFREETQTMVICLEEAKKYLMCKNPKLLKYFTENAIHGRKNNIYLSK